MRESPVLCGPAVSVVVPVYNESPTLVDLHQRLVRTLKDVGRSWEVVFVDDGSVDGSADVLRALHAQDPAVRVVRLSRNYGQHAAVLAGLERARGEVVVTLDADLQNPPEEIPRLLDRAWAGADVVAGVRQSRRDGWFRRLASHAVNRVTATTVGVRLQDYGCMLRVYRRPVVDAMLGCPEAAPFIPALACLFARSVVEVPVAHAPRRHGRSRYGLARLLRLNFDLLTGFSLLPIECVTVGGAALAAVGLLAALVVLARAILSASMPDASQGLLAVVVLVGGLQLLALGLIGQYVGRIFQDVRRRPRYVVAETLE